jgi:outer membrane protein
MPFVALAIALQVAAPAAPAQPPPARTLTLQQATETALHEQPQLRVSRAQVDAANARADEARAPLLPQITGTATYRFGTNNQVPGGTAIATTPAGGPTTTTTTIGTSSFWNFGLSANQLIYDFGQTTGRWRSAQANAAAQQYAERSTRLQTVLNVRTAYFQARSQKSLITVAHETLANFDRHLTQIQGFVELGTRPQIDLAQAKTDVANAKVQVIAAENNYASAKAQLNQAIGVAQSTDYDVIDDSLPPVAEEDQPTDTLVQAAALSRPELAQLGKQIEAQEQLVRSAKGNYAPTLGASTSVTEAGRELDNLRWNWSAQATLTWPLFQGGLTVAQVREAEANLVVARAQRDASMQQIRLDVEQARLAVRAAKASLDAVEEALTNAKERLRLAEGRYQTGAGSVIELGDAQIAMANAAAQRVTADYNLAAARAQLLKALGRE